MSLQARVISAGTARRENFDKTAPVPFVEVVVKGPMPDAKRMAADFDPSSDYSP